MKVTRHDFAGLALGVDDALALRGRGRHGLLGDDIAAQFHCAADVLVVKRILGGHDHRVRLTLGDHAVEVLGRIAGDIFAFLLGRVYIELNPTGIAVTEGDEFAVLIDVQRGVLVHERASARTDDGVTFGDGHGN